MERVFTKDKVDRFTGEYRWLSNFSEAEVYFGGFKYKTTEHAYVAAKTHSKAMRFEVSAIPTAGQAKQFGRSLQIRPDWDEVRVDVMRGLLKQKFSIPEYREKLWATRGLELVEGNVWHDKFWGVCICEECGSKGENQLGKLLMEIREELAQLPLTFE